MEANFRTNATAGSSRPSNNTATQQSKGTAQTQSSSQSHAAVSMAPPVVGDTTSSATPHMCYDKIPCTLDLLLAFYLSCLS